MANGITRRWTAALLICVLLSALIPSTASAVTKCSGTVYVKVNTAYIYEKAATSAKKIAKATYGQSMAIGAYTSTWCYVKYNGKVGYIPKANVSTSKPAATKSPTPTPAPSTAPTSAPTAVPTTAPTAVPTAKPTAAPTATAASVRVQTISDAKLYYSPSTSAKYYGTVAKGKTFPCLKTSGDWAYVQCGSYKGYMLKGLLKSASSSSTSTKTTTTTSGTSVICYMNANSSLYSSSACTKTVGSVKKGDKVLVYKVKDGIAYLVTTGGTFGYLKSSLLSKTKVDPADTVVLSDWYTGNIQKVFPVGSVVTVVDVLTRTTFNVYRHGGLEHADCEPKTATDTTTILKLYGGKTSWDRRAIWVKINGTLYAASMNFMNHGESDITTNKFDGHFCIHFLNSRTHGTNKVDPDHQAAIKVAYTTKP